MRVGIDGGVFEVGTGEGEEATGALDGGRERDGGIGTDEAVAVKNLDGDIDEILSVGEESGLVGGQADLTGLTGGGEADGYPSSVTPSARRVPG